MFFVEPVTGAMIGKIWEERKLIAGYSKDFWDLLANGRLKIFVFGCAGTGKSTFGKILDGQENVGTVAGSYTLSSETEFYGLRDKRFVQISIPPGQDIYHQRNWGQLFNSLQDSSRAIVINLVCWGWRSTRARPTRVSRDDQGVLQRASLSLFNTITLRHARPCAGYPRLRAPTLQRRGWPGHSTSRRRFAPFARP
jgi:hypothetical protein